jgi:L-amino acid N-acyltransferase YncA
MSTTPTIRLATQEDAPALLAIYAPYVRDTAITFEYSVPSLTEFQARIKATLLKYPYFVAEENGILLGYAYASMFKERAAYAWSAETSVYVSQDYHGNGLGRKLYTALEETLQKQNICNLNACIAYPNPKSILFHERLGYKKTAHFTKCGYKDGKWYDMIWMEKIIGKHLIPPKDFIAFPRLDF